MKKKFTKFETIKKENLKKIKGGATHRPPIILLYGILPPPVEIK